MDEITHEKGNPSIEETRKLLINIVTIHYSKSLGEALRLLRLPEKILYMLLGMIIFRLIDTNPDLPLSKKLVESNRKLFGKTRFVDRVFFGFWKIIGSLLLPPVKLVLLALAIRPRIKNSSMAQSKAVQRPPGVFLLRIVEFLYSPKTVEETFKQIVADWREEFYEALNQGKNRKARWISVRYTYSFILSMGLSKVYALFKSFKTIGK